MLQEMLEKRKKTLKTSLIELLDINIDINKKF